MTAAPAYASSRPASPDQMTRRRALAQHIYAGDLVPSAAMQPGEFYVTIHHALLRAMICAHKLNGSQLRYLLCVLEYSSPDPGYAVIRNAGGWRVPEIQDWCAWLDGMKPQQVYTLRRELAAARVIRFVDGDPNKVAFNSRWETWDTGVFQARPARPGAGRRRHAAAPEADLLPDEAGADLPPATHDALFFAPSEEINGCGEGKSLDLLAEINKFAPDTGEPAPVADLAAPPNTIPNKDLNQEETPATAGVTQSATTCPASVLPLKDESEKVITESASSNDAGTKSPIHPPRSARPPLLSLPERRNGETTRTYWLRVFGDHEPAGRRAQRAVVHAATREVLGFSLDKDDLRLLGQLRRAASSWGTVLHWVLKTGDVAAVDVHAYLYGFLKHERPAVPASAPAASWLPVTEQGEDAPALPPVEGTADADEPVTPAEETDLAARARKLGMQLRASGIWRTLEMGGLPVRAYQPALEALDLLREQGRWTQTEFVSLLSTLASVAILSGRSRTQRWECLVAALHRRVCERLREPGAVLVDVPDPASAPRGIVAAEDIEPAEVGRRARVLRRICGAGTDLGQALLAYTELGEREALELSAGILLRAHLAPEHDHDALTLAWAYVQRLGATMCSHTTRQRQHHWFSYLRAAAGTLHHQKSGPCGC